MTAKTFLRRAPGVFRDAFRQCWRQLGSIKRKDLKDAISPEIIVSSVIGTIIVGYVLGLEEAKNNAVAMLSSLFGFVVFFYIARLLHLFPAIRAGLSAVQLEWKESSQEVFIPQLEDGL